MNEVERYASNNTITVKDVSQVLESHRKYFRWNERERVLDIGCGPGNVTANIVLPFLPKDSTLIGCDISEAMIEACNKYKIDGRLTFKQLDIQQRKLENGWENESFDKIFSFYCLHWITDHRQAFQNIYSLLKPGGEILLMFLTPQYGPYVAFEILKNSPKWNRFIKNEKWFYETNDSISFCEEMLENVGFQETKCYLRHCKHTVASWKIYMELIETVNPFLPHIPTEMKQEFMEEFENVLKQQSHVKFDEVGDGITVEYQMIVAAAKKMNRKKAIN